MLFYTIGTMIRKNRTQDIPDHGRIYSPPILSNALQMMQSVALTARLRLIVRSRDELFMTCSTSRAGSFTHMIRKSTRLRRELLRGRSKHSLRRLRVQNGNRVRIVRQVTLLNLVLLRWELWLFRRSWVRSLSRMDAYLLVSRMVDWPDRERRKLLRLLWSLLRDVFWFWFLWPCLLLRF